MRYAGRGSRARTASTSRATARAPRSSAPPGGSSQRRGASRARAAHHAQAHVPPAAGAAGAQPAPLPSTFPAGSASVAALAAPASRPAPRVSIRRRARPLSPRPAASLRPPLPLPGQACIGRTKWPRGAPPATLSLWPERWATLWPGSGPLGLLRAARCASPPPHGRAPAPHTPTPPQDRSGDPERPPRAASSTIPTPWGPGRASQT